MAGPKFEPPDVGPKNGAQISDLDEIWFWQAPIMAVKPTVPVNSGARRRSMPKGAVSWKNEGETCVLAV